VYENLVKIPAQGWRRKGLVPLQLSPGGGPGDCLKERDGIAAARALFLKVHFTPGEQQIVVHPIIIN
jgi:hypothetical protein